MIHIATAHYGPRWVDVQLEYFARHLREPYTVWGSVERVSSADAAKFDVALPMGGHHQGKLNLLWHEIDEVADDDDLVLFCDSDSFPIADPMPLIRDALTTTDIVAIRRDEDGDRQPHPAFAIASAATWRAVQCDWGGAYLFRTPWGLEVSDAGSNLLHYIEERAMNWTPLLRSNTVDLHPLWFAVYGGIVYHHGGGSQRYPLSRTEERCEFVTHADGSTFQQLLDVPTRLRRKLRVHRSVRLSRMIYRELADDPEFYRQFVEGLGRPIVPETLVA